VINERFSGKGMLKKYKSELSPTTLENLLRLNKYFGGKSAIRLIRRKFAFHLDADTISSAYDKLPTDFTSTEYLSDRFAGHNLFHISETLTLIAMADNERDNWQNKLDDIVEEITEMCAAAGIFLSGFIGLIFKKYLDVNPELLANSIIDITDEAAIDSLRLPFFSLPPRIKH
jgi:hypothetical protein